MRKRTARNGWIGILVVVFVLIGIPGLILNLAWPESLSVSAQQVQLLNPGFEGGFGEHGGIGELVVANGWRPWYVEGGGYHRPEYVAESRTTGRGRVRDGAYGQKQFTTYSKQDGGLVQEIATVPGNWYKFDAWVYVWSTNSDGPDSSPGPTGSYSALLGINPWGDCRATYRTTVWGKEALRVYNQWVQVSVTVQAWTNKVCVFTRGTAEYAVKHNDSYWDSLALSEWSRGTCPTPSPTPIPGADSCPSLEAIGEVVGQELRALQIRIE